MPGREAGKCGPERWGDGYLSAARTQGQARSLSACMLSRSAGYSAR
jgi:hypothetical protein